MKVFFACLLFLLVNQFAYPFIKVTEQDGKSATLQIDSLNRLAKQFTLKQPEVARTYAGQGLVLAKKYGYKRGIGESFNIIGVSYWVQSSLPVSQFYLALAVPYLKNDNHALSDLYRSMARNYVDMKDYKLGLHYFKASIKKAGKDTALRAVAFTELTSIFNATNDFDNGIAHIALAFKYARKSHNTNLIGILYERLGQLYVNKGSIDSAGRNLDSCFDIAVRLKNKRLLSVLMIDRARLACLKNQLSQAINYANQGLVLADSLGSSDLKLRALKVLTGVYQRQGDFFNANKLQTTSVAIYDSVQRFNNTKTLKLIKDYADLNKRLNDIEQDNLNNLANRALIANKNKTIALLVGSLITAMILLVVIFIYYRQKNQLNNQLRGQHQTLSVQKKLIEEQRSDLQEVNQLKDKLLAIIGHDLRTPIANLSSIADLFAQDYISADEVKKLMHDLTPIIKGAELTLLNLMDFASSQMIGQKVVPTNVNLFLIGAEMMATFEHQLQQKNIQFINQCDPAITVWGDSNHVKVILRNLISNAVKFTGVNGKIWISTKADGDRINVCVRDNGIGMTPEQADQLFKGSRQFSQRGTLGEKGTGLGLLLCKELIDLNNGKLWVDTTAEEGSCFCFSLPVRSV